MTFSMRLKQLRQESNVTQVQFAKFMDITDRTLRNYEAGRMEPALSTLAKIAEYFNVTTDYLLGLSDERQLKNDAQ